MTKEKGYFVKSIRIRQMDAELLGQTWDLKLLKPEWVGREIKLLGLL
ncbi:6964_t:CDS:2 [Rhizophagus irregularis]|nr:6964_t:CDS:2 [Rhizophagus irregularis]